MSVFSTAIAKEIESAHLLDGVAERISVGITRKSSAILLNKLGLFAIQMMTVKVRDCVKTMIMFAKEIQVADYLFTSLKIKYK